MNEMNVNWDDLRLFLAVARGGGLASACAATGKSAPTLGRRMLQLELQLGYELFIRQARGYELTEEGQTFFDKITPLEDRLVPLVAPQDHLPLIKISAGTWVSEYLCQNMKDIYVSGTARLRFLSSETVLDIGRREALIGIRNARPTEHNLACRMVGQVTFATYARNADIQPWAQVMGSTPSAKWVQTQTSASNVIEVTSPRNGLDLAKAGMARVVLPTFIGKQHYDLKPIGDPIAELTHDQWMVMHHEDRYLPEVRKIIDRIYKVLTRMTRKDH